MCHFCLVTRQIVTFCPFGPCMSDWRKEMSKLLPYVLWNALENSRVTRNFSKNLPQCAKTASSYWLMMVIQLSRRRAFVNQHYQSLLMMMAIFGTFKRATMMIMVLTDLPAQNSSFTNLHSAKPASKQQKLNNTPVIAKQRSSYAQS